MHRRIIYQATPQTTKNRVPVEKRKEGIDKGGDRQRFSPMVPAVYHDAVFTAIDLEIVARRWERNPTGSSAEIGFLHLGIVEQIARHPLQHEMAVFEDITAV